MQVGKAAVPKTLIYELSWSEFQQIITDDLQCAAPSVLIAAEQSSSTTCAAPTDEDSSSAVKKTRFILECTSVPLQATRSSASELPQACPKNHHVDVSPHTPAAEIPEDMPGVKWTKMRKGVDKMTERCSVAFC